MSLKEDLLRAYAYGKDAYYQAIQHVPSYQAELERVNLNYNARTWIDFSGFLPKFTNEEFEKRRVAYQAKYGNTVNVPGFSDVIHIIPKASISAEERAAHLFAIKRGLPSPLSPAQIESLAYKKFRFIKALAAATPDWMKTYGSVATMLDNIEDALVTVVVLSRFAARLAPRLLSRLVPGLGWILLGSDMLNAVNIVSYLSFATMKKKRLLEDLAEKNPFHAKAAARRTFKLKRVIPTFGEFIEVLQTTDQLFGVGLCLGGLMGMVTDAASTALNPEYWKQLDYLLRKGTVNEIAFWISKAAANDYNKIKRDLKDQWFNFRDESYRIQEADWLVREQITNWVKKKADETWGWVKSIPDEALRAITESTIGSMILSTGKDDFDQEDHTKAFMFLDTNIQALMPWWLENDPLTNFKELREWKFRAPVPTDPITIDNLNTYLPEWQNSLGWPHLGVQDATIEEIGFTYAPMIKDSFQTYCLRYKHQLDAMIAAQQCVMFTKNVIKSFSDDNDVRLGMTAWWAVAEDLSRDTYIMPPDTPAETIQHLADYVSQQERELGEPPNVKDVVDYGEAVGIEWMRTFPARGFEAIADLMPEWRRIQEEVGELFLMD